MKIRIGDGLLPLNLLVVLLIVVVVISPSGIWRIILGLPLVLFSPGYALTLALFPKKGRIGGIERAALSFGISVAVVPLIVLCLNYTRWGIAVEPVLYSIASFVFAVSIIALVRRRRLLNEDRLDIELRPKLPGWGEDACE